MTQWQPQERTYDDLANSTQNPPLRPRVGSAAYWADYDVELPPERSVLDGILQVKDREDEQDDE